MKLLNGQELCTKIKKEVKKEMQTFKQTHKRSPGLGVVLVGDNKASEVYVNMKKKACHETGIYSVTHKLPQDSSTAMVLRIIEQMNNNLSIDGILVQLPLPEHIDNAQVIDAIVHHKDVDGFSDVNMGKLWANKKTFAPCTPLGVMNLLQENNINVKGLNACVIGASNIAGKPMAALLLNAGATVEICHIFTDDLAAHTKKADLVVVGVGHKKLITQEMVKQNAIVIDIGINKTQEGKIVGDIDFDNIKDKCSFITPVPGGVGPMTIAMLLQNCIKAAWNNQNKQQNNKGKND